MPAHYVYILTNHTRMFYVGITDDIRRRIFEHKTQYFEDGYTARYGIGQLVYYEELQDSASAASREIQSKGWSRKKNGTGRKRKFEWIDLSDSWFRSEDLASKYFRELDDVDENPTLRPRLRNGGSPSYS